MRTKYLVTEGYDSWLETGRAFYFLRKKRWFGWETIYQTGNQTAMGYCLSSMNLEYDSKSGYWYKD